MDDLTLFDDDDNERLQQLAIAERMRTQTRLLYAAGITILITPGMIYFGEILCHVLKIAPPDTTVLMTAAIAGISTILAFGFPRGKK